MYAMMLFADERLLSVKPAVSSLRKSLIGPSTSTRALQVAKDADNPVQIPWVSSIASSVDKAFEVLVFGTTDELAQKGKYNLFHLLSIMRYIPLTHLYAFSMWRSSEAEAQESRDYLQTWMKREPVVSRQCLWHATMIFESIKRKRQHACYEPFTLLIAILTIWAFDTLSEPHNKAHSGWSDMDSVQPSTRINRLGTATEVESWARSAQNGGVFVDDIGLLRGSGSSRRLMMEGLQILSSGTAWPRLRAAIAHGVSEVLQGRPPSHPEE
jgi:hypothetical protein